jgi:phenylacetate-coenzyme A ligase PaaK-like adenylate-forming protein
MAADAYLAAWLERILEAPAPYYHSSLASLRSDTSVLSRLARLPLTPRAQLVDDQRAHPPAGTRRLADAGDPVRAGMTGSGDDLLVLLWSAADLARERRAGARLLRRLGIQPGMRVANTLPGALATPGSLLIGDVIEEIGCLDVPLGSVENEATARQASELVDRVQPAVLVLEPVSATRLFAAFPAAPRPWWQGIVWLRTDAPQFAPPQPPPGVGFSGWQRTWLAVAETTSFVAHTCSAGLFHVDDEVHAEVIDAHAGVALPADHTGTLVLTPCAVDTALLRYVTRLRVCARSGACACGMLGPRVQVV